MTKCPNCGQEVPERHFCVRCGTRLTEAAGGSERFAAAPREHRYLPSIVSSLFPHLPAADMNHYRVAMAVGTGIVVALGIAGLFPLALAAAALLVPALAALYLHDVNVYEDEPLLVIGFTLAWGAIAGVLIGVLAHVLSPERIDQLASGHRASPLVVIVLLPLLELVLAVAGPALVLLPHRRYNDVLDGVTFGAATAAALSATEVIVNGYRLFEHGLAPGGHVLPWILRLLTLRMALPILAMAATGAACGALWLRVRGPAADRKLLGPFGHPVIAFALRAGLLMAAAAGQRWLPVGAWLATLLVLDAIALIWLRMMLQLGLREESAEGEIGPDVQCPNCGAQTPQHTFCAECGVALRALPKQRRAPAPAPPGGPAPTPAPGLPALARPRLMMRSRVQAFVIWLGVVVVGLVVIGAIAPKPPQARCSTKQECGAPPTLGTPLQREIVWRSSSYGFSLEYPPDRWQVKTSGPAGIELRNVLAPVDLLIEGSPAAEPRLLVGAKLAALRDRILGLANDPQAADTILGSAVGYRYGAGGAYVGAVDSPQGVQDQALLNIIAASDPQVGIVATTLTTETNPSLRRRIYGQADAVINTVTWPGQT